MSEINLVHNSLRDYEDKRNSEIQRSDEQRLENLIEQRQNDVPLTQDDLIFLYEVDRPIVTSGRVRDPRIEQLWLGRNQNSDMLIIFDCAPDQIVNDAAMVTEDTKVYIGPLHQGIFKKLAHVEHIYIDFPEKKIRSIELSVGGVDATQLIGDIELTPEVPGAPRTMHISDDVKLMMRGIDTIEFQRLRLVRLTVADLGFVQGGDTAAILNKAKELGLTLCPPVAGLHLRLQLTNQPIDSCLYMGMNPIPDPANHLSLLSVGRNDSAAYLLSTTARPTDYWTADRVFVFGVPQTATDPKTEDI